MFGGTLGTISNAADWDKSFRLRSKTDGTLFDMTGATVTFKVRPGREQDWSGSGADVLTGSTTTGEVTLPSLGVINWRFPASTMAGIDPGTYRAGVIITRDGETVQLFLGTVAIKGGF